MALEAISEYLSFACRGMTPRQLYSTFMDYIEHKLKNNKMREAWEWGKYKMPVLGWYIF